MWSLDALKRSTPLWTKGLSKFKLSFSAGGVNSIIDKAGQALNRLTEYDQCELLKETVNAADMQFQILREQLQTSRQTYSKAILERSVCQKELNGLLQRKPSWIDTDLQRFTELYRNEMRLEASEATAKETNERLEKQVDDAHHNLVGAMRERYQEEQLWSDKIRRASTFGTFGLMLMNVLLFLTLHLFYEPKRRKAFIEQFEDIVVQKLDQMKTPPVILRPVEQNKQLDIGQALAGGVALLVLNFILMLNFK